MQIYGDILVTGKKISKGSILDHGSGADVEDIESETEHTSSGMHVIVMAVIV